MGPFHFAKVVCPNQASRPLFRESVKRARTHPLKTERINETGSVSFFDNIWPRADDPLQSEKGCFFSGEMKPKTNTIGPRLRSLRPSLR
jgi:hypothetical protein